MEKKTPTNEWLTGTHSGLVSIDRHNLFLSASGPDRAPGAPVVILESGIGGSASSWALVARHLSRFVRVYVHDRAGLGSSEPNFGAAAIAHGAYAENAAEDLDKLLRETGVDGPFILVAMSWGGIVAREFLQRRREDVVGMVMIECCQEKTCEIRPIDGPNTMVFLGGLDYFEVTGTKQRHKMLPEEWQAVMQDVGRNAALSAIEYVVWPPTEQALGQKKQLDLQLLGNNPISVIKGNNAREYRQVFDAGVAAGNGTEEQRRIVSEMIDGMEEKDLFLQKEQLRLSTVSRFVQLEKPGHLVILEEPEAVAKEVQWVLKAHE